MPYKYIPTRLILSVLTLLAAAFSAARSSQPRFGHGLDNADSKTLIKRAVEYTIKKGRTDSAALCYTIVANRRYYPSPSRDVLHSAVVAMNNLGYIYSFYFYDYQKAYSYLQEALKIAEENKFDDNLPYIYINLALIFQLNSEMHNQPAYTPEITGYLKKAFSTGLKQGKLYNMAVAFVNMAGLNIKYGKVKDMAGEIKTVLALPRNKDYEMRPYTEATAKALTLYNQGRLGDAAEEFDRATATVPTSADQSVRYTMQAQLNKIIIMQKMGRYAEAASLAKQQVEVAQANNQLDALVEFYGLLYPNLQKSGRRKEADKYYVKYLRMKDSILAKCNMDQISNMKFSQQLSQIDEQVRQTAQNNRIQRIVLWAVAAISAMAAVFLLFVAHYYRKKKKYVEELYRKNIALIKSENQKPRPAAPAGDAGRAQLLERIEAVLDDAGQVYSPDFSLDTLARLADSNYKYVSQAINEAYGKSFKTLLNELRIREACRRLSDAATYGNLTIEAISEGVGFKSRSNFAVMFKRVTGLSPSQFQRTANTAAGNADDGENLE